jgi:hypothetical protein
MVAVSSWFMAHGLGVLTPPEALSNINVLRRIPAIISAD